MKSQIKTKLKTAGFALILASGLSCSNEIEQETYNLKETSFDLGTEDKFGTPRAYNTNSYFTGTGNASVNFTGTTSTQLNTLIRNTSGQKIIKIPRKNYTWGEVNLKSGIHLQIAAGTVIKPTNNNVRRIFNIGTSAKGARVTNTSISGVGGGFTIDLSALANLNKNMAAVRIGRVTDFKLFNFTIKDRRTSLASILLNYVANANQDNQPFAKQGIIQKIRQTGAHTGYGLIQGYSADQILFKDLDCQGGVTLRLETDDRSMKNDVIKTPSKKFGMFRIFADDITCTDGICPLMLSPHFTQNGKVTAKKITSTGCAFAVRIEHGFIEVFDKNKTYTASQRTQFTNFISNQISGVANNQKFIGNAYRRANGTQWAIRITDASINGNLTPYIKNQIGNLKNGSFQNATFGNVRANKGSGNKAKLKQGFLKFYSCNTITNTIKRPTNTGMPNGFEYYGPALGLKFDNTQGVGNGNYKITVNGSFTGGSGTNILHNTPAKCNSPAIGQIGTVSGSFF
ncbi:hypothetical protein FHR24_000573 [Wenyingzhuangia heitensis]|uniref:Lipoprotein n=1 Tax=Wenyingzhuangia heitensis TaxID=1487859 RepID=A0ABX0U5L8_9FLAO|nr:hypothetical protein [Wenyingzhuangia heitensis]NIJ44134.1 hypothetical protein [Wenyingzhuangia heitensis]